MNNGKVRIVDNHEGSLRGLYESAKKLGLNCPNDYYLSCVEYRDEDGEYCDYRINDKDIARGYTSLTRWAEAGFDMAYFEDNN